MALVGYFSMEAGTGTDAMADDILAAGHTPVLLDGSNWDMIDQIDTLYVWNGDNSSYLQGFVDHMPAITTAVQNGMNMVVFDRAIGEVDSTNGGPLNPSVILPGADGLEVVRYTSDNADLTAAGETMIGGGPAPGVDDTSLDGGNYTTHGFAQTDSLPPGATVLMTPENGDGSQAVGFVYMFGAGMVQYYGIPMDFYDQVETGWDNPWQNFAVNALAATTICIEVSVPVLTDRGARPIGSLQPGDLVATLDHGFQPVLWVEHDATPRDLLEVAPGVLGNDLPLRLTRQHRVMIASPLAELAFGSSEVLAPAAALAEAGLAQEVAPGFVCNLILPRHEVIMVAGGAPVETLLITPAVRRTLGRAGRQAATLPRQKLNPARPILAAREAAALLGWVPAATAKRAAMAELRR